MEDVLLEAARVRLCPLRNKPSQRTLPPDIVSVQHYYWKRIETVGSFIERMRPKTIYAVTAAGVELKVCLVVLAYGLNCLYKARIALSDSLWYRPGYEAREDAAMMKITLSEQERRQLED